MAICVWMRTVFGVTMPLNSMLNTVASGKLHGDYMRFIVPILAIIVLSASAQAADLTAEMHRTTLEGSGAHVGSVKISQHDFGTTFSLQLSGMTPLSEHGFHVHANGSCGPADKGGKMVPALAAGGHWDPDHTGKHQGPMGHGHKGDLPFIQADKDGRVTVKVTAVAISDVMALKGHALMIHEGGDNYKDIPKKLGGGGARMFCGVIG